MLWALAQPAAAAGLLGAFLLGVGLRVVAQRLTARGLGLGIGGSVRPRVRRDLDPFGALAAVFGGTGWGRQSAIELTAQMNRGQLNRGRRAVALVAGPLVVLVASQVVLAGFAYARPDDRTTLVVNYPSDVLRGVVVDSPGAQLLLSVGVGLLCFALLALVPLPPLDGFGLWWLSMAEPGERARRAWRLLADHHLGLIALLILVAVPLGARAPIMLQFFDVVATPLIRVWA